MSPAVGITVTKPWLNAHALDRCADERMQWVLRLLNQGSLARGGVLIAIEAVGHTISADHTIEDTTLHTQHTEQYEVLRRDSCQCNKDFDQQPGGTPLPLSVLLNRCII